MPKYIDADDLISVLDILCDKGDDIRYWEQLKWIVADCPTADVVEVVRCKDCHHWKTVLEPTGIECEPGESAHYCWIDGMITRTNDYCSYGRRK